MRQNPPTFHDQTAHQYENGCPTRIRGMGYQDFIRLLYGYSFDAEAIVGVRILESRETPGLGDRIETDPEFVNNFLGLDVSLNAAGDRPALQHIHRAPHRGSASEASCFRRRPSRLSRRHGRCHLTDAAF